MREVTGSVTDEADYDLDQIWMAFLVKTINAEMMLGWKDSDICIILATRCQFHQHFTSSFFVHKYFAQLLHMCLHFGFVIFGKRILVQKLLIKSW